MADAKPEITEEPEAQPAPQGGPSLPSRPVASHPVSPAGPPSRGGSAGSSRPKVTLDRAALERAVLRLSDTADVLLAYGKPILHAAWIPLIIVLGMRYTEPRPSWAQLLSPM